MASPSKPTGSVVAETLLSAKNLEFTYAGASAPQVAVREFSIARAERIFLYGPSGSGKTTFLELLAGVLRPQKGELRMLGRELERLAGSELDGFRADHIGYIFQSFNLIPYLTVRENVLLPLTFSARKRSRVKDPEATCRGLLEALGLADFWWRPVAQLSVGQQQRVAAARALIGEPELILADEPTSALDFDHRQKFLQLLFSLAKEAGTAILFVSHDRTLDKLFDRALAFDEISGGRP